MASVDSVSSKFAKEYTHLKENINEKKNKFRDWDKICKEFMTNDKQDTLDSHCSPEKLLQPIHTFVQG